jgi:GT2 family glycosyltransferase
MTFLTGEEILSPSSYFELVVEDEAIFFVHKSGQRVRTDKWGKAVWEGAPGTLADILAKLPAAAQGGKEGHPGGSLTKEQGKEYVSLLYQAGLLTIAPPRESSPSSSVQDSPEQNDLISVVVITFNGMEHIKDCFSSLERQTYTNLEIIAVDNASEDRTAETLHVHFPKVQVFALVKNLHYAGAVNFGLKQARGKYILILNQDVELEPECIARLYRKAAASPQAGAVVPMMKFFSLRGFINGIGNHIRDHSWGSDNFIGCVDIGQFETLEEVPSACFGAVLLRRNAVREVGYLDEKYTAFYEDTDWSFRCWLKGWTIVPAVKAVVYHKFGASYPDRHKLKLVVRNRMRLVLKIFRGRILFGFLRRYWKEDLKNMLSSLKKGRFGIGGAYARAHASLLFQIPNILAEKRRLYRKKSPTLREKDVLAKNPAFFSCLDENNQPVIDIRVLSGYYHSEFARIRGQEER